MRKAEQRKEKERKDSIFNDWINDFTLVPSSKYPYPERAWNDEKRFEDLSKSVPIFKDYATKLTDLLKSTNNLVETYKTRCETYEKLLQSQEKLREIARNPDYNSLVLLRKQCALELERYDRMLDRYTKMSKILPLIPKDVWFLIFFCLNGNVKDINNCVLTCKTFYSAIESNYVKIFRIGELFQRDADNFIVDNPFTLRRYFGVTKHSYDYCMHMFHATKSAEKVRSRMFEIIENDLKSRKTPLKITFAISPDLTDTLCSEPIQLSSPLMGFPPEETQTHLLVTIKNARDLGITTISPCISSLRSPLEITGLVLVKKKQ
jgi:hypothetical protein